MRCAYHIRAVCLGVWHASHLGYLWREMFSWDYQKCAKLLLKTLSNLDCINIYDMSIHLNQQYRNKNKELKNLSGVEVKLQNSVVSCKVSTFTYIC